MGKRLGKQKSPVKLVTKALSVLMAASPVLLQTDAVARASAADPIPDMYISLGHSAGIDLASKFGPGESFTILSSNPDVADYAYADGFLEITPHMQGFATFTVTPSDVTKADTFRVGVIDPGADARVDIGDVVKFAAASRPFFTNEDDYKKLIREPIAPMTVVSHVPVGDGHSPAPNENAGQLGSMFFSVTNSNYEQFAAGDLKLFFMLDDYFNDADQPVTYSIEGTSPHAAFHIVNDAETNRPKLLVTANAIGSSTVVLKAADRYGLATWLNVNVSVMDARTPMNHAPTVSSVTYEVYWPGPEAAVTIPLNMGPAPLFADPDGDTLTYQLLSSTGYSNGVHAQIKNNSTVSAAVYFYGTPTGPVSFGVRGTDPGELGETMTFHIPYGSVPNPAPTVTGDTYKIRVNQGETSFSPIALQNIFSDTEPLEYSVVSLSSTATVTPVVSSNGTWDAALTFTGTAYNTFGFSVEGTDSASQKATKPFVFEVNQYPYTVPGAWAATVNPNTPVNETLPLRGDYGFFYDDPADVLTFELDKTTGNGLTAEILNNGTGDAQIRLTGTPTAYTEFTITATDSGGLKASKKLTYNIFPTLNNAKYSAVYVAEGKPATLDLDDFFEDPGDSLTYEITGYSLASGLLDAVSQGEGNRYLQLNVTGMPSGAIAAGTVTVTAKDTHHATASKTFSFYIDDNRIEDDRFIYLGDGVTGQYDIEMPLPSGYTSYYKLTADDSNGLTSAYITSGHYAFVQFGSGGGSSIVTVQQFANDSVDYRVRLDAFEVVNENGV